MSLSMGTKPRPMPRMNGGSNGTSNTSSHAPSPRGQDYSSSEGEEDALTGNCSECEECARNQAVHHGGSLRHGHHPRSTDSLDANVPRVYGYGSASDDDHLDRRSDDTRHQRGSQRGRKHPRQRRGDWQRAPPGGGGGVGGRHTPGSSRSSSRSRCDSDAEHSHSQRSGVAMGTHMGTMGTVRTMDSSSTGENFYSRINDTATLPLPHIPPPPPDMPGPAVPPRPLAVMTSRTGNAAPYHPMAVQHRTTYHELEPPLGMDPGVVAGGMAGIKGDFEPQFIQTTPDGIVFVPPAPDMMNSIQGGHMQFPRTVPRTASLPRHSRILATPANSTNTLQSRTTGEAIPMITHDQSSNNINPSYSFDRIKLQLKELEDTWSRQNVTFNQNATLLNNPPQYPSIHSDFRDYATHYNHHTRYDSVKKKLRNKCSWRCATVVLSVIVAVLVLLLAYFIAIAVYDLNWGLQPRHAIMYHDLSPTEYPTGASYSPSPSQPAESVIVKQYEFGRRASSSIPAHEFWRTQFYLPQDEFIKFNFSVPSYAVLGVYLRRSTHPTHAQYDYVHILDGAKLEDASGRQKRALGSQTSTTAFIEYLESGVWFVFIYNDDTEPHKIDFGGATHEAPMTSCPSSCHGHGECKDAACECFPGYTGWDCSQSVCPVVCHGNGLYVRGECDCYDGWKGKECSLSEEDCSDPTCSGNGKCVGGTCVCSPGFTGEDCSEVTCIACSENGVCDSAGVCVCYPGYRGAACTLVDSNHTRCIRDCSDHGVFDYSMQQCICSRNWFGENCELEICRAECIHGTCENQRCVCDDGWTGAQCDVLRCGKDCHGQGHCDNGTCVCDVGFNGRYCSLDGCPRQCNNHGSCQYFRDGWQCSCRDGWKGKGCDVAMETQCDNAIDDDRDGLYDCLDPDCCMDVECAQNKNCNTAPDPMEILLRMQPPSNTASFYDRMRFLAEDDSVQSFATLTSFDATQVSVIRGRVVATDSSPLIGVRVSVVTQPLYGFTLTREQGLFDILVNGGGSVVLKFQRQPFISKQVTVIVPWNEMVTIETVTLATVAMEDSRDDEEACEAVSHDHYNMRPVIMSTWQHTQLGACPQKSAIIPESQVLQESQQIPGTDVYLVYHSSEAPGYQSTILIQLTPDSVPENLALVHLRVSVEGLISERMFEAYGGLKYTYAWNRRNAYNQKVHGVVSARVDVGYEYEDCSEIFWHTQAATMSGYDITSSEIGGWNLHIHHTYNFQEGILHKGDGTNIYLNEQPRKIVTVLGTSKQRRIDCKNCDGAANTARLMAPVALASGRDGSLYIGDYNYVRKVTPERDTVQSILQLNMPEVPYRYFMVVSPSDGRLYLSDYETKQIIRVKTMGAVRDLARNFEVIVGSGEQCYPGDEGQCGDGARADRAKLFYPKGLAINKDGVLYFADGANIRMVSKDGIIHTVIGHQGPPKRWSPLPCEGTLKVEQVTLKWPTALSINPLDDTLHILDNNMVLKLTKDHKNILVVSGYPLHCPPIKSHIGSLLEEQESAPKLATEVILLSPVDIAFSPSAKLFIVESDGDATNRVRVVNTDGTISHYAGAESGCECDEGEEDGEECECVTKGDELATKAPLKDLSAITVTPDNVLHIAEIENLRIHSVLATLPKADSHSQYEILHPETQERFYFNRFGQHVATKHLVTDQFLYNFTYNVNSFYGKLTKVTDAAGGVLEIMRDYATQATEIIPPGGHKCHFTMDNMGMLQSFTAADNSTTFYTYISTVELLDMKKTSSGLVFLYDYDENGRLREVVEPTGERLSLTTDVDSTGMTSTHVSYLQDGSLIVEYPFNMAVTLETSPHPLLNTEHQLQLKRRVILPGNVVHRLEWRYFPRYAREDGDKVMVGLRRRVRVGGRSTSNGAPLSSSHVLHEDLVDHSLDTLPPSTSLTGSTYTSMGYAGKYLLLNGVTILIMEYDREANTETFTNTDKEGILTVYYDRAGNILSTVPMQPVAGVNISYNANGKMADWSRGNIHIDYTYDERSGNLLEKRFGSRGVYKYLYKQGSKPTDVLLPSGKQYSFHYDSSGNLRSIVMPSLARHKFHSLVTLGLYRLIYHPPGENGAYIRDYNNDGQLKQIHYPSGHRRQTFYYTPAGRVKYLFFDWTDVEYAYYTDDQLLHSINISDRIGVQFECSLVFKPNESLVRTHEVIFGSAQLGLANAKFGYAYDSFLRIASIQATIGAHSEPAYNFTFNPVTGHLMRMKQFRFDYPRLHRTVIRDENMQKTIERDSLNHISSVVFKFINHVKFELEVTYDSMNRLQNWRRRVGTSDIKYFEYTYDVDNNVIAMHVNGQETWRYEIDANSNIKKISRHSHYQLFEINMNDEIISDKEGSYMFDKDGFLIMRGRESFEYSSRGHLTHAFERGVYDIYYYYDGLGRLAARHDFLSGDITQYYYSDVYHKHRITHIYYHTGDELQTLFYDNQGRLFALQIGQDYFYIALDPIGSPIVIFNARGSVVKQVSFNPLGEMSLISGEDFRFDIGFQCGVFDPITSFVFLKGRVYQPYTGRWTGPDYGEFLDNLDRIWDKPEATNHYAYKDVVNTRQPQDINLMTDIPSWLNELGYNMDSLIPTVNFMGDINAENKPRMDRITPIVSAFECAFNRDIDSVTAISTVPKSKITVSQSGLKVKSFEPLKALLGKDIMLSTKNKEVSVDLLENPNPTLANLASVLLNNSQSVEMHFTVHGRDVHYFVKPSLEEAQNDARALNLRADSDNIIGGVNLTIQQHHQTPNSMLFADYRLHGNHSVFNIRYGTTVETERERILNHAMSRAIETAWLIERELAQSNKKSMYTWTQQQKNELSSKGMVTNIRTATYRDVSLYPELADDPKNIRFIPVR